MTSRSDNADEVALVGVVDGAGAVIVDPGLSEGELLSVPEPDAGTVYEDEVMNCPVPSDPLFGVGGVFFSGRLLGLKMPPN